MVIIAGFIGLLFITKFVSLDGVDCGINEIYGGFCSIVVF